MNRSSLITLIVALLALIAAVGAYTVGYLAISAEKEKATALARSVAVIQAKQSHATSARSELAQLIVDETAVAGHFVGKEDVVPFLETLQGAGRPFGSQVNVLSVSDEKGAHPRIIISLSITGSFDAVMRTLGSIEFGPYDEQFTNLTLDTTGADAKGNRTWTAAGVLSVGTHASNPTKP